MLKIVIITLCLPLIIASQLIKSQFDSDDPFESGKIIGGHIINITETPWQIALLHDMDFWCSGSIISERLVLTAAHCTHDVSSKDLEIRAGTENHKYGGIIVQVVKIFEHPSFNHDLNDYDFSILKLELSLEFSSRIAPITLPDHDEDVADKTVCLVSGWGDTINTRSPRRSPKLADQLRGVLIPTVNQEQCVKAYAKISLITKRMICAGYFTGHIDSCQGLLN